MLRGSLGTESLQVSCVCGAVGRETCCWHELCLGCTLATELSGLLSFEFFHVSLSFFLSECTELLIHSLCRRRTCLAFHTESVASPCGNRQAPFRFLGAVAVVFLSAVRIASACLVACRLRSSIDRTRKRHVKVALLIMLVRIRCNSL